ncbi:anhydro-N-acetylmuramic acid kinase [Qingshengfaniella alkalisoli]|uniref:Anhydro-N-acetylmuramic acid kinase n=1 Tax=Qingshengfaniella alkalisoli TaxID=2599296 RepID=A0A5B8IW34_9RHOB|nr:anhydro-N-acetylmuramic acid kinase [Qingshengfaniella alkalisoli]QDY68728.1 anhydro-N-acetylmuramic acid kinase [Qingshengfaniella alkalisoli]
MKGKTAWEDRAVWVAGTMSGTSLDGVDVAMLLTDGVEVLDFGAHAYRPYSAEEQKVLRAALNRWQGDPGTDEAARIVEQAHVEVLRELQGAELVGFHGQTLAHEPRGQGTYQAGNGQALATALRLPVVWDFRTADVHAGGEGAPLAPVYHFALARWVGVTEPVVFLNLGGVGNLTYVDPNAVDPFASDAMLAFDTGPANAPLNDLMMARFGRPFDEGGEVSGSGQVSSDALKRFIANPYFCRIPPKSLDRNDFAELVEDVSPLDDTDAAATLVEAAALGVANAVRWCPRPPAQILVAGGGRKNPRMMRRIAELSGCIVEPVETVGLNGDMLEAQAFAYMAMRNVRELAISGPDTTGAPGALTGGRLSYPR